MLQQKLAGLGSTHLSSRPHMGINDPQYPLGMPSNMSGSLSMSGQSRASSSSGQSFGKSLRCLWERCNEASRAAPAAPDRFRRALGSYGDGYMPHDPGNGFAGFENMTREALAASLREVRPDAHPWHSMCCRPTPGCTLDTSFMTFQAGLL